MNHKLIKKLGINSIDADIGSDWHLLAPRKNQDPNVVSRAIDKLRTEQKSKEALFLLGDMFDACDGQNRSELIREILDDCSRRYEVVIYTPGNHCLRGRENPWNGLSDKKNVIYPNGGDPILETIQGKRLLIGDLFYDFEFIDPAFIGTNQSELLQRYKDYDDGKHLLNGRTDTFRNYTNSLAERLDPSVDILVTHVLPTPALTVFKFLNPTPELLASAASYGFTLAPTTDEDAREAATHNLNLDEFRMWWNVKSFIMGSDVLGHPAANPRNELLCLHGHNHKDAENMRKRIKKKDILFESYQPYTVEV